MARELEIIYVVRKRHSLSSDNTMHMWFEVWSGHSARDYQAENYKGMHTLVGKYHTEQEANAAIDALGGRRVD